jgi:hypothetical protein
MYSVDGVRTDEQSLTRVASANLSEFKMIRDHLFYFFAIDLCCHFVRPLSCTIWIIRIFQ